MTKKTGIPVNEDDVTDLDLLGFDKGDWLAEMFILLLGFKNE